MEDTSVEGVKSDQKIEDINKNEEKLFLGEEPTRGDKRRLIKQKRKLQKKVRQEQNQMASQMRRRITAHEFYAAMSNHQQMIKKVVDSLYLKTDTLVVSFQTLRDIVLEKTDTKLDDYMKIYDKNVKDLQEVQKVLAKFKTSTEQVTELKKLNIDPDKFGIKVK